MKPVVQVDPKVFAEAQRLAEERGVSVETIVEQAVSDLAARTRRSTDPVRRELPTFGGTGVRPGVNLDRTSELLDLMEGDDPR